MGVRSYGSLLLGDIYNSWLSSASPLRPPGTLDSIKALGSASPPHLGSASLPTLSHVFPVNVRSETPVESLIDAFASVVPQQDVDQVQHVGGHRFKVVIRSQAAVSRFQEACILRVGDQVVSGSLRNRNGSVCCNAC